MKHTLFATDLDGTMVGDIDSLVQLNVAIQRLRQESNFKLVYVTARSLVSYQNLMSRGILLQPDALISSLGTEIYIGEELSKLSDWPTTDTWKPESVRGKLSVVDGLTDQPMTEQNHHKISYYIDTSDTFAVANKALSGLDVESMFSGTRYLDILPKGIHKGSAVKFLADLWNIDLGDVITAGDSPNDIAMLDGYRSIVVGNAQQLLLDWVASGDHVNAYLAKSQFAAGVTEGLRHYGVFVQPQL